MIDMLYLAEREIMRCKDAYLGEEEKKSQNLRKKKGIPRNVQKNINREPTSAFGGRESI